MIPFSSVPSNLRVPFVAVEVDNSRAQQGPALLAYRALLIGQKIASGTATANSRHRVTSADQVATLAGRGSQLHRNAKAYFANNGFTETWIGVLEDNGAGVVAMGTLTVTGPATADGTLSLYVAGELVQVAVTSGDTATDVAAAIVAAITAAADLPVTAAVGGLGSEHIVTVTARNKGTAGNDVNLRLNYLDSEATPAGIAVAIVAMASGATNPVLTTLLAALGDTWYQIIAHPYTDATSLTALEAELADRYGPMRMIPGVAIASAAGSVSTLGSLGDTRNSPHSVLLSQPGASPMTPPAEFAAAVAGVVAFQAPADPARPLQTLEIKGVVAPAEADYFTLQERNLLLFDGVGTTKVSGGQVQIERLVTTYQTNAAGSVDTSYLDATTLLTLIYLRYSFRTRIQTRFPRVKLANDGARLGPGQAVITPLIGKGEALNWFRDMEALGLVENFDQFKTDLVVERNALDPNRLDFKLSPDLINQLIVGAVNVSFLL